MPGGGTELRLGPFKGGLNNASDPSAIDDTELVICDNFEFDVDGALTSRPPIVDLLTGPVGGQTVDLLGYYVDATGTPYLIGSTDNAVFYFGSGTWVTITTGFRASAMVQYKGLAWIIAQPGSANPGGSWVPTSFGAAGTFTAVASLPKGGSAAMYKERMFIAPGPKATTNESRLSFSALADPNTWNPSDFIDISPGDGQKLLDLWILSGNIYLFKNDSTYIFAYDSAPTKGVVDPVSSTIGVSDTGCVTQYENVIYVYHEDFCYELINGNFSKLNVKVQFSPNFGGGVSYFRSNSLSVVGDRLVVRYFDKIYVFNFRTRTWSTWTSTKSFGRFFTEPRASNTTALPRYTAGNAILGNQLTYIFQDGYDSTNTESITCTAQTKVFDFDAPGTFKRLYWWGVDVLTTGIVTGMLTPVIYTFQVTWDTLAANYDWDEMAAFTWDQPGNVIPTVSDSADTSGSYSRKLIKFLKAIRFRNIFFTVTLQTTGKSTDAPVKLFTVSPIVQLKERAMKQVN